MRSAQPPIHDKGVFPPGVAEDPGVASETGLRHLRTLASISLLVARRKPSPVRPPEVADVSG